MRDTAKFALWQMLTKDSNQALHVI